MYDLAFDPLAAKELRKLDGIVQRHIGIVLERLLSNPSFYMIKLAGQEGFRVRAGDFRIIVDVDRTNKKIRVLRIGHRRNIYSRK
mgnify:CR=1 FL=1